MLKAVQTKLRLMELQHIREKYSGTMFGHRVEAWRFAKGDVHAAMYEKALRDSGKEAETRTTEERKQVLFFGVLRRNPRTYPTYLERRLATLLKRQQGVSLYQEIRDRLETGEEFDPDAFTWPRLWARSYGR